jgi:hypothetical protein
MMKLVRNIGMYITKTSNHAAWVALVCALLPFFGFPTAWLSMVVVALITLQRGVSRGIWVLAWAALPAIALAFWGLPLSLISMVIIRGFFLVLFAYLLRRFSSWSLVVEVAALAAAGIVIALHFFVPEIAGWWQKQLVIYFQQMNTTFNLQLSQTVLLHWAELLSTFATGLMGMTILVVDLSLLLLARGWQAGLFNPGGLRREFYQLRLSYAAAGLAFITLVAAIFGSPLALDLLPILLLPPVFAGLSLLHLFCYQRKSHYLLWIVYILLMLAFPYIYPLLALIGFADVFMDFRQKLKLA